MFVLCEETTFWRKFGCSTATFNHSWADLAKSCWIRYLCVRIPLENSFLFITIAEMLLFVTAHSLTFHVVAGNKQNWLDLPLLIDGIFFILSKKTIYFWLSLSKFIISFSCFSFYVINLLMFFYIIASFLHSKNLSSFYYLDFSYWRPRVNLRILEYWRCMTIETGFTVEREKIQTKLF